MRPRLSNQCTTSECIASRQNAYDDVYTVAVVHNWLNERVCDVDVGANLLKQQRLAFLLRLHRCAHQ
jgi:hypothetical protein